MGLYDYIAKLEASAQPEDILVYAIVRDLRDRKGFRHTFDDTDSDTLIEMIDRWRVMARDGL